MARQLGHPSKERRNLAVAAEIVDALGDPDEAAALRERAAMMG